TLFGEKVSWAEFVGQICALAVVFLAQRRTLWTWPVQIAATVLLFVVYTSAHLGGLATRQVVIFLISAYGWWAWLRHRDPVYGVVAALVIWGFIGWVRTARRNASLKAARSIPAT